VVSRHDLTKVLFEALPKESQDKILTNKRVSTITEGPDGLITVSCRDETSYIGNYVVGSDGAHSIVRDQMRNLALASGSLAINEAQPFETAYRCLWMRIPSSTSDVLKPGTSAETHGIGCATQLFAGEETTVVGVYEKLEKPTKKRMRFTPADEDALIERWGHLVLLADRRLTLRQVYENRIQSGLVSLEEGVVDHWSWDGRIVLAGDAAHKFTPSGGAGCNNGIVDVISLANEVARTMDEVGMNPSKTQLSEAFGRYQALRYPLVSLECKDSGDATAMAIWSTGTLRFVDRHVLPNTMFQRISSRDAAKANADTPSFDYIAGTDVILGKIPWTKPMGKGAQS
jgi:2-polyprenyl-6-methoxyphenol hydroxylase-like FAD-dependent oxidoreductase